MQQSKLAPLNPEHSAAIPLGSASRKSLSARQYAAVGLMASGCDWLGGQVFFTMRTWQQHGLKVRSVLQAPWRAMPPFAAAVCNIRQLYTGFVPMYVAYGTQMGLVFWQKPHYEHGLRQLNLPMAEQYVGSAAWLIAATTTSFAWSAPIEALAVNMQMAGQRGESTQLWHIVRQIRQQDGSYRRIWRGASAQALRTAGFVGAIAAVPDGQRLCAHLSHGRAPPWLTDEVGIVGCGLLGALVTNPADVMKTSMQQVNGPKTLLAAYRQLGQEGRAGWSRGLLWRSVGFVWAAHVYTNTTAWFAEHIHKVVT